MAKMSEHGRQRMEEMHDLYTSLIDELEKVQPIARKETAVALLTLIDLKGADYNALARYAVSRAKADKWYSYHSYQSYIDSHEWHKNMQRAHCKNMLWRAIESRDVLVSWRLGGSPHRLNQP